MTGGRSQAARPKRAEAKSERPRAGASGAARNELIRALVHDLRNPLNVVLTWTHLLADARLDDDSRARALASIRRESERQARLLSDIAEYCALGGDGQRLELEPLDLGAVVVAAIDATRAAADDEAPPIDAELDAELEGDARRLSGDAGRLGRAVRALLGRALESANGAQRVRVSLRTTPRHLEIEVADDGAGLTAAQLERLFEPLPERDDRRGPGGLRFELPIAERIARAHGGSLKARSRGRGHGASLVLRLPRQGQPRARAARTVRTTSSNVSGGVGLSR